MWRAVQQCAGLKDPGQTLDFTAFGVASDGTPSGRLPLSGQAPLDPGVASSLCNCAAACAPIFQDAGLCERRRERARILVSHSTAPRVCCRNSVSYRDTSELAMVTVAVGSTGPLSRLQPVPHLPRRGPAGFAAGAGFLVSGEGSGEVAGFVLSFFEIGKR